MITFEIIQSEYRRVLDEVIQVIPLERWDTQPTQVNLTSRKAVYGLATPAGEVLIAKAFIGTTAYKKLDFVLRHEFAHLAVGLHRHHNKLFRRAEYAFGVRDCDLSADLTQLEDNIQFKYTVIAHFENGDSKSLGGVHRKSKCYSEYTRASKRRISVDGKPVVRFEFIENG